ncbi:MAG: hypothetical protein RRC34_06035 [Lentisphaeria bacterium]|nr:hypothetical protein [Lentisphaeria bacterium]
MRIVNEKYLALIWNWDDSEKGNLQHKFQTNLERLVYAVQERMETGDAPSPEALRSLAEELQEAGELLQQSAENCLAVARVMYTSTGDFAANPDKLQSIEAHIGKPVILSQTSAPEIEGRQLILHEIRGIKAILKDGDSFWEALIDFVVPVEEIQKGTVDGD